MHLLLLVLLQVLLLHPPYSASLFLQPSSSSPPAPPIVIYQQQQQQQHINRGNNSPLAVVTQSSRNSNINLQGPFLLLALLEQQGAVSSSLSLQAQAEESIYRDENQKATLPLVGFQSDTVVRVMDANHVRLQRAGLVSLAAVKTPSSSGSSSSSSSSSAPFSECLAYSPEYKLRQLLPAGQPVKVKLYNNKNDGSNSSSNNNRQVSAVILKNNTNKNNNNNHVLQIVNQELVAAGFAVVRKNNVAVDVLSSNDLKRLESIARLQEKGLFRQCSTSNNTSRRSSSSSTANNNHAGNHVKEATTTTSTTRTTTMTPFFVAKFQPLDQKGTSSTSASAITKQPKNPGDKKGCFDFETYEDAVRYYEYYYSWYGDVARLDRKW